MKYLSSLFLMLSTKTLLALTPHAYVANQTGNSIQIIDIERNAAQLVYGFTNPHVIKVTPDGTRAYIGEESGQIHILDTLTNLVLPNVVEIPHPIALAISPDNSFFCVVSGDDTVTVVRTSDLTIVTTLSGFNDPQDVKISNDSQFAYVTNASNGTINVFCSSDWSLVATISGMEKPVGIALTNDGKYAYVTDPSHGALYQIDLTNNTIVATILGFNSPAYSAMTPDGDYAYISDVGADTVVKLRLCDNQIFDSFNIPSPKSIACSLDGESLLVGSTFGTLYEVRTLDHLITTTFPGGLSNANPSNIALTSNNPPEISLNGCQTTTTSDVVNHITWSPAPGDPIQYDLYRDIHLQHHATSLQGTTLEFEDHDRVPGQSYWYFLVARYENGFSSQLGSIQVDPNRTCLGGS